MLGINNIAQESITPPPLPAGLGFGDSMGESVAKPHPPTQRKRTESPVEDPYPLFPAELKEFPRWLTWKYEIRHLKTTKVPYDPQTNRRASDTDPSTWRSYAAAVAAKKNFCGLGCIIGEPYCGIDLDKCRDEQTGIAEPWAERIIEELASFTEVSPSGRGFHIWIKARKPEAAICRKGRIECYDHARYFAVTGRHVPNTPPTIETRDIASFLKRLKNGELEPLPTTKIETDKSQSEIDFQVCVELAREFGSDPARIEAEFNKTFHAQREKWRDRQDYRERTIRNAIAAASTSSKIEVIEGDELPVEAVPIYPLQVLDGDSIGDLAHALTEGTPIPPQYARETIKTVIGSVIDGRVGYPAHEESTARQFNINVSLNPRSGKGESWKRVAAFGTGILWDLLDEHQVRIIQAGIGSGEALIRKLAAIEKDGCHQVVLRYDEMGELLAKAQVQASSLEYKLLSFYETRTGSAESLTHGVNLVEDMGVSLCGDFVEQDFIAAFAGRGSGARGFLPRCVLSFASAVPHVGDWKEIDSAKTIRICERIGENLDTLRCGIGHRNGRWIPSEDDSARAARFEFFESLKTQDPNLTPELTALMKRDLIHRALFSDLRITRAKVEKSISWCQHQLEIRRVLWPEDRGDNVERMAHRILAASDGKNLSIARLMDYCHVKRLGSGGPEAFYRALTSLQRTKQIAEKGKNRKEQPVYARI